MRHEQACSWVASAGQVVSETARCRISMPGESVTLGSHLIPSIVTRAAGSTGDNNHMRGAAIVKNPEQCSQYVMVRGAIYVGCADGVEMRSIHLALTPAADSVPRARASVVSCFGSDPGTTNRIRQPWIWFTSIQGAGYRRTTSTFLRC